MKTKRQHTLKGTWILTLMVFLVSITLGTPNAQANNDPLFDGTNTETQLINASVFLGAGSALLITSFLIQPEKKVLTGYNDWQVPQPIYTTIGTDTSSLQLVSAIFLGLGAVFFMVQSDGGEPSEEAVLDHEGVGFETTVLCDGAPGAGFFFSF